MKRFFTLFLAVFMVLALSLSLAGCGKAKTEANPPETQQPTVNESSDPEPDTPEAPDAGAYVASPDDPYPRLILGLAENEKKRIWTMNGEYYVSVPSALLLDTDSYSSYIMNALTYQIETGHGDGPFGEAEKRFAAGPPNLYTFDTHEPAGSTIECALTGVRWTKEYGLLGFYTASLGYDELESYSEGIIFYSQTLGRPIDLEERYIAHELNETEGYELYKDEPYVSK